MSYISKRERVFNDYETCDLPARNEGKLKAYASCTDARAWSHFCSDKSEHLVEVIKRNNEAVRTKYIPTHVIVDTLMVSKKAEITRLKKKITEFEQMLAAYDDLDLTCEQKCEIATAHAAIKSANKDLEEMCLDLDLSGYTEGLDSEAFETGKSLGGGEDIPSLPQKHGDVPEAPKVKAETKAIQIGESICNDQGTFATDSRIDDMQDVIINKDAKLNAMKNSIAVMENDLCEPYYLYAHIYTALEKIFGALSQNDKYRQYLSLLSAGKDTRGIDIRGKIIFKLKILEKFSEALISPCNSEANKKTSFDCTCYRSEVSSILQTNFAMHSTETMKPNFDNKRSQLVADIIENDEMKEILSKDGVQDEPNDFIDAKYVITECSINEQNLERLKKLQECFDDLLTCYETTKYDKECLEIKVHNYEALEIEYGNLINQIKEYNSLWNEKEYHRKRSCDLDKLKEQYLLLTDETANLETQLKAEIEINHSKCKTIDELRNINLNLEQKLSDSLMSFEKERTSFLCKLKEADCRNMCQDQQIKSLSLQVDRLLEQDHHSHQRTGADNDSITVIDEIESKQEQINNLKSALLCNEEEKQNLFNQYQDQLKVINGLKMEIDNWQSMYDRTTKRNDYLEKYTSKLLEESKVLAQDAEEKSLEVHNLVTLINSKSEEINKLVAETETRKSESQDLRHQIETLQSHFDSNIASLEREKNVVYETLHLAREESQELLQKVKNYDDTIHSNTDVIQSLRVELENNKEIQCSLLKSVEENQNLKERLLELEHDNATLSKEVQKLCEEKVMSIESIKKLQDQNKEYNKSLELAHKETNALLEKLSLQQQMSVESHKKIEAEKKALEHDLNSKSVELNQAMKSVELSKQKSQELINQLKTSESVTSEIPILLQTHEKVIREKNYALQQLLRDYETLLTSFNDVKNQRADLLKEIEQLKDFQRKVQDLQNINSELLFKNHSLQSEINNKQEEFKNTYATLKQKIKENLELSEQINRLENNEIAAKLSIKSLEEEKVLARATLCEVTRQSSELVSKIKYQENVEEELDLLRNANQQSMLQKDKLQRELDLQLCDLQKVQKENIELQSHSQNLLTHNEDLEKALIISRTELINSIAADDNHPYRDIMKEIEGMRQEKLANQSKIRDLLDKLDYLEQISSNLNESVMARDEKIAILENHINELDQEIEKLQINLAEAVDAGEQITTIDAHHSKATHNMKIEIAKLRNENIKLEDQLSVTRVKSDEFSQECNKYIDEIVLLKEERDMIVTEIQKIEIKYVGDAALSHRHCSVDNILHSLDRIKHILDAKNNINTSLEKTILKVKTSSQFLLSKAEEAKKLFEKEKQEIIAEKEEAMKDKQDMEKQLKDLKKRLEKQISQDKNTIIDLEASILNQKLEINKINQLTEDYISKLKEELENLQNLYKKSLETISGLQDELNHAKEASYNQLEMLNKLQHDFSLKCKELTALQKELKDLENKSVVSHKHINIYTQTDTTNVSHHSIAIQTDEEMGHPGQKIKIAYDEDRKLEINEKPTQKAITVYNVMPLSNANEVNESQANQSISKNNKLQILNASVEPTLDYVRNCYKDYKLKCLSTGKLEQYSITNLNDTLNKVSSDSQILEIVHIEEESDSDSNSQNRNLLDIYYRKSEDTSLSKEYEGSGCQTRVKPGQNGSAFKVPASNDNTEETYKGISNQTGFTTQDNPDSSLFVIFKDHHNSFSENEATNNKRSKQKEQTKVNNSKGLNNIDDKHMPLNPLEQFNNKKNNLAQVKPKLDINLLKVENNSDIFLGNNDFSASKQFSTSNSKIIDENGEHYKSSSSILTTLSDDDLGTFGNYINETALQSITLKPKYSGVSKYNMSNTNTSNKESRHNLSRVDADVLLLKSKADLESHEQINIFEGKVNIVQETPDFGLEYILRTVQAEIYPGKEHNLQKSKQTENKSANVFVASRDGIEANSITDIITSNYKKIASAAGKSLKNTDKTCDKMYIDQSVMVKLDVEQNYEETINNLTKALTDIEKDYKIKIESIKTQYDNNIKEIINEHNEGVKNIQGLHEDTLQDIIKVHENEVENLRSMSIEAMRKAERLERENKILKNTPIDGVTKYLDEEPTKISKGIKKRRRSRGEIKLLTKTMVEAFNVKPKPRCQGLCTCSLDVNVSDTVRNIFEQVDIEQRKMAEQAYTKYIANKIVNGNIEILDTQELSFLHLRVCSLWKAKLSVEESLQKKIDSLELELKNRHLNTQKHIADLDRKVAEEQRRLQVVRDAVCPGSTPASRIFSTTSSSHAITLVTDECTQHGHLENCACNTESYEKKYTTTTTGRGSAGDLSELYRAGSENQHNLRSRGTNSRNERAKMTDRRDKKLYHDDPPTRLRRSRDRQGRAKK